MTMMLFITLRVILIQMPVFKAGLMFFLSVLQNLIVTKCKFWWLLFVNGHAISDLQRCSKSLMMCIITFTRTFRRIFQFSVTIILETWFMCVVRIFTPWQANISMLLTKVLTIFSVKMVIFVESLAHLAARVVNTNTSFPLLTCSSRAIVFISKLVGVSCLKAISARRLNFIVVLMRSAPNLEMVIQCWILSFRYFGIFSVMRKLTSILNNTSWIVVLNSTKLKSCSRLFLHLSRLRLLK